MPKNRTSTSDLEACYANRRKKIIKSIQGNAALFCTAPRKTRGRHLEYPYCPDSDFFYLTGFSESESALLLFGTRKGPKSILYVKDRNPTEERWRGTRLGLKRAKRRFQVDEVRNIGDFKTELPSLLSDTRALYYAPGTDPEIDSLVWSSFCSPSGPLHRFPEAIKDSRLLTSEMRFVKDRQEIRAVRHAVDITARGFIELAPALKKTTSEIHASRLLESFFSKLGAHSLAFETIVAGGKNATYLHHTPGMQPLRSQDLALVDAGASFSGYAGDISRTFPMSGAYSPVQAEAYDVVLSALEVAVTKAKPGATLNDIHKAAARTIAKGLVQLDILDGSVPDIISSEIYKPFFMHRTSHFLGIDVHDTAPIYDHKLRMSPYELPLQAGNVITIEPGLYFDHEDKTIPNHFRGIGIRIEEDVLITPKGCEVLSSIMPRSRDDIEAIMR